MKTTVEIFVELGEKILLAPHDNIYNSACLENEWFTIDDVARAVEAIRSTMLSREELIRWMEHYPTLPTLPSLPTAAPQRVLIVMAGNIPLVGFFDLLCVIAAGHHAIVKPSHKDHILIEWIIELLREIEPSIPIYMYSEEREEENMVDRVIATGGEAAMLHFESLYRGTPTLLRGSRHSIAVIGDNTSESELNGLEGDIYSYSGLGCRNVSLIFAPRGWELDKLPSPQIESLNPKYRNNYLQNRALLTISGGEFYDSSSSCLIYQDSFPLALSTISIVEYETIDEVERWIEAHDSELQCIVAQSETINHPRRVNFGEAQCPTLFDYADGVDTMKFLE